MTLRNVLRPGIVKLGRRFRVHIMSDHEYTDTHITAFDGEVVSRITGRDPQVVFDVGANVGQTVATLRQGVPSAHIYSFEPGLIAASKLRSTWGSDPNVTITEAAVSNTDGETAFFDDPVTDFSRIPSGDQEPTRTVRSIRLDTWANEHGIERVDILKIDAEGHEPKIIEGASGLFAAGAVSTVVLEFGGHPYLQSLEQLITTMHLREFALAFTFAPLVRPGYLHHSNAFFIRRDLEPNLRYESRV